MYLYWVSFGFLLLSGLIHVLFFVIESYLFQQPNGAKYFKVSKEDHQAAKVWALNQGFYNLFFAFGMFYGLVLAFQNQMLVSVVLCSFCALSMIGAGVVLWFSAPQLRRGFFIQAIPPLIGLIFLYLHLHL